MDRILKEEKEFTGNILESLLDTDQLNDVISLNGIDAIRWFVNEYPLHIYALNLSNTQSRRSRAGKEFELILELLLKGANVPFETQRKIGTKRFEEKGLGKLLDIVSPSIDAYKERKRDVILISAKTTLRERWTEVVEEVSRTSAREMFLATLDDSITPDVAKQLDENNIQLVVLLALKETKYKNYSNIMSFEELLKICMENFDKWIDIEEGK